MAIVFNKVKRMDMDFYKKLSVGNRLELASAFVWARVGNARSALWLAGYAFAALMAGASAHWAWGHGAGHGHAIELGSSNEEALKLYLGTLGAEPLRSYSMLAADAEKRGWANAWVTEGQARRWLYRSAPKGLEGDVGSSLGEARWLAWKEVQSAARGAMGVEDSCHWSEAIASSVAWMGLGRSSAACQEQAAQSWWEAQGSGAMICLGALSFFGWIAGERLPWSGAAQWAMEFGLWLGSDGEAAWVKMEKRRLRWASWRVGRSKRSASAKRL